MGVTRLPRAARVGRQVAGPALFLVALAAGLTWFLSPVFQPGPLLTFDHPVHLAEIEYVLRDVIPHQGWITGWCPADFGGFPLLLYSGHGGPALVLALAEVPGVSVELAYKLTLVLALCFPLATLGWLIRDTRGSLAAALTVVAFLSQRDLLFTFLAGMWESLLALGLLFLLLRLIFRGGSDPSWRTMGGGALLLGAITLTHWFVAAFSLVIWVAAAAGACALRPRPARSLALAARWMLPVVLGIGLGFYQVYPLLTTHGWLRPQSLTGTLPALSVARCLLNDQYPLEGPLRSGDWGQLLLNLGRTALLPSVLLEPFALLAVLFAFEPGAGTRRDRVLCWALLSGAAAAFLLITGFGRHADGDGGLFGLSRVLPGRWKLLLNTATLILAGLGLGRVLRERRLPEMIFRGRSVPAWRGARAMAAATAVAVLLTLVHFPRYAALRREMIITPGSLSCWTDAEAVWSGLVEAGGAGRARVLVQDPGGNARDRRLASTHLWALGPARTGMDQIGGWSGQLYATQPFAGSEEHRLLGVPLAVLSEAKLREGLAAFNATHVLALEPQLTERLRASGDFSEETASGPFTLFRQEVCRPGWLQADPGAAAESLSLGSGEIRLRIHRLLPGDSLLVKVTHHPYWRVVQPRGSPLVLAASAYGQMVIRAGGPLEETDVVLRYDARTPWAAVASAGAFLFAAALLFIPGCRRQRAMGRADPVVAFREGFGDAG